MCPPKQIYRGGSVVEGESSTRGMGTPPIGSSGNMVQIRSDKSVSICLRREHILSPVLFTKGDGCVNTFLARDPVICFPTDKPYPPHTV